jgi:hypothetical protein
MFKLSTILSIIGVSAVAALISIKAICTSEVYNEPYKESKVDNRNTEYLNNVYRALIHDRRELLPGALKELFILAHFTSETKSLLTYRWRSSLNNADSSLYSRSINEIDEYIGILNQDYRRIIDALEIVKDFEINPKSKIPHNSHIIFYELKNSINSIKNNSGRLNSIFSRIIGSENIKNNERLKSELVSDLLLFSVSVGDDSAYHIAKNIESSELLNIARFVSRNRKREEYMFSGSIAALDKTLANKYKSWEAQGIFNHLLPENTFKYNNKTVIKSIIYNNFRLSLLLNSDGSDFAIDKNLSDFYNRNQDFDALNCPNLSVLLAPANDHK